MPRVTSCHESHDVWWVGVNSARERSSIPTGATDPVVSQFESGLMRPALRSRERQIGGGMGSWV